MISGHSRATLLGAFAIVFGVAQMICACMPASAMTAMDMADPAAQHYDMPVADMPAMDMADHDCPHCEDQASFVANMPAGPIAMPVLQTFIARTAVRSWQCQVSPPFLS